MSYTWLTRDTINNNNNNKHNNNNNNKCLIHGLHETQ